MGTSLTRHWWLVLILVAGGCGGADFPLAPVSGTVTLDGEPVADARVSFQPLRQGDAVNAGPGSFAKTDQQGRYRLETMHGGEGAVVGRHVVRITTLEVINSAEKGYEVVAEERIPARYVDGSTLQFRVTEDGTDEADFKLTSK